jgi:Concanavalin A-like lectin/glucanases superfamily/Chitobiase/beta-hexosaminidase C-terminal domain
LSVSVAWSGSGSGLVGFWNFDGGSGLIANDDSGNNNRGVLVNGPQWTRGRFGSALSFDGLDDHVEVVLPDRLGLNRELTVSAWIYNESTHEPSLQQSEYHIIAAKGWAADVGGSWTLGWDRKTNSLFFCARKRTDNGVECASFDFGSVTDDWHLVTGVFNDGIIRLYVDGLLAAGPVSLGTARINNNSENVYIGGLPGSAGNSSDSWHGLIDEVQISNVALTNMAVATIAGVAGSKEVYDFSLRRPGELTVAQGAVAATSINASLLAGTPRFVSFSVSGLPRNVSGSFSTTSCSPSCSTILTVKADSNSDPGTYSITVTAKGGRAQQRTSFKLTIVQPTVSTVATPTITPSGGSFTGPVSVSLQNATSGASIYYTTDGSTPTQSSRLYVGAMTLTDSAVVKAKAFKSGHNPSGEANASFKVNRPFDFSLSNSGDKSVTAGSSVTNSISATLASGTTQPVTFSVSGLPSGATASFSSNSCSPSCSSTLTISTNGSTPAGSSTITVTTSGGGVTKTTQFNLGVGLPTLATPTISPNGGTYTGSVPVALQTSTAAAAIYYTTDGSTPTQSSTLYTGPVTLTKSAVVKARTFKNGYNASAETSASFTITQGQSFSQLYEAENAAVVSPMVRGSDLNASGGQYISSVSGTVTVSPTAEATLSVSLPSTNTYHLWVRLFAPNVNNDAAYVGIDASWDRVFPSITNAYEWVRVETSNGSGAYGFSLAQGVHTVKIGHGELNVRIDALFITTDPNAAPPSLPSPSFNFLMSNSGDKSVNVGSSVTNTISATLVSGSAQPVTFSASGLPSGATASFSSGNCSLNCSSTLTITTSASTPGGNHTITVTGNGGGMTRTTSFSLGVNLLTAAATPTISPTGGTYTGSVSVTLQTSTAGAAIYYTTDGSTPTQSSTLYTGAMTLTSSAVVKAKTFKSGYNPSSEASATFTIVSAPAPRLTVTWQDNSNNEDNFKLERKTGTNGSYVQIATVAANNNSYADAGVIRGTTYCYRVRAANSSAVSGYSNEGCATVP